MYKILDKITVVATTGVLFAAIVALSLLSSALPFVLAWVIIHHL